MMVIGVSDRMLTAGDVEYEPELSKIFQISTACAIMTAGDAALQREICLAVATEIGERIKLEPETWVPIEDVAKCYGRHHSRIQSEAAERAVLRPLGLTTESFLANGALLNTDMGRGLTEQVQAFRLNPVQSIILGIDPTGPHLFQMNGGDHYQFNGVGFTCIGIGAWHASSQLMNASYCPTMSVAEGLLLCMMAKKRAEVAPGVGEGTDLVAIGPLLGHYVDGSPEVVQSLGEMCQRIMDKESEAIGAAVGELQKIIDDAIDSAKSPGEPEETESPTENQNGG